MQKAEAAQKNLYLSDLHMKKRQLLFQSGPQNGLLAGISQYFASKKMAIRHEIIGTKVTRKKKNGNFLWESVVIDEGTENLFFHFYSNLGGRSPHKLPTPLE